MIALHVLLGCGDGGTTLGVAISCPPAEGTPDPAAEPVLAVDPLHRPTNVVLVTIDTLRRDHVGRYAGGESATPFLDGLLAAGIALDDFRACSNWTLGSLTCLLGGADNLDMGFEPLPGDDPDELGLPEDLELAPAWLSGRGFETGLVSTSAWLDPALPTGAGAAVVRQLADTRAASVVEAALEVIDELRWNPYDPDWVQVHFSDPHEPYDPPEGWAEGLEALDPLPYDLSTVAGMDALAADWAGLDEATRELALEHLEVRYRGELAYLDAQLEVFWAELERRGVFQDTLVVLASDHGEQWWEHGRFRHGFSLHQEEAMAVGLLWWSASPAMGLPWTGPVAHEDLLPTIYEALGLDPEPTFRGLPVGTAPPDRARYSFRAPLQAAPLSSVDREGQRLLYTWNGDKALYDATADPLETVDLYNPGSDTVQCLWDALDPAIDRALGWVDAMPVARGP